MALCKSGSGSPREMNRTFKTVLRSFAANQKQAANRIGPAALRQSKEPDHRRARCRARAQQDDPPGDGCGVTRLVRLGWEKSSISLLKRMPVDSDTTPEPNAVLTCGGVVVAAYIGGVCGVLLCVCATLKGPKKQHASTQNHKPQDCCYQTSPLL